MALTAAQAEVEAGRLDEGHELVEQLLDREPTDEAAHRLAIELYAAEGRHHAARRQFELCRRALEASYGVEPSPETETAYRRAELAAKTIAPGTAPRARLVGRRRELARVEPLLDCLAAGRSGCLVIRGPAGVGKTRLLDEVRDLGRGAGWRELSWQAIESGPRLAYAPFARLGALVTAADVASWPEPGRSALATILPGFGLQPQLEFSDRSALLGALIAVLAQIARTGSLLIAIDDVPWLDEASLEVIAAVRATLVDVPILLLVTYRDDEALPAAAAAVLDGLRRNGALELHVGPLVERDIEPLILSHLGGESVAPDLGAWLFRQGEGNPLFCLEVARDAAQRGAICLENGRWHASDRGPWPLVAPQAVRELVAARIRSLQPAATAVLQTAAELGPVIAYDTLSAAMPDLEGGLIPVLDAAIASGLLAERGGGYAFAHPLFRVAVEAESGVARRAGVHLAIARALSRTTSAEGDVDPAALAQRCADPGPAADHALAAYEVGLREAGPLAVGLGFAAGLRARRLFDRAAATAFLERAGAVWRQLPEALAARFDASTAFVNIAELRMAGDDEAAAETAFRAAIDAARSPDELARAYDRFSFLQYRHGDFAGTIALCEEALVRLPADAPVARAEIEVRLGFCLGRLHRLDEAVRHLEDAVRVLDAAGDLAQLCQALDHIGPFLAFAGRSAEGLAALERSLAIALDLHHGGFESAARIHLAAILTRAGRAAEARPHARRGLELAEQLGEWYTAAVAAWLAAEVEDALGDDDATAALLRRELAHLARIGGNAHNEALAHAHFALLARRAGDAEAEVDESAWARKAAAADVDQGYAARIELALKAERWSDVLEY